MLAKLIGNQPTSGAIRVISLVIVNMERVTRLELATSSLARRCSTTELHPHPERVEIMANPLVDATFNCHEICQNLESKERAKRISLTNDTYEDTVYHQPLFHRARSEEHTSELQSL